MGLTFNTVAGFYTLWKLKERESKIDRKEGEGVVESKKIMKYVDWLHDFKWQILMLMLL